MIREAVRNLVELGPFSSSAAAKGDILERQETLIRFITPPASDEEAKLLVALFGPDDYFGLAWTLLHLVESAPSWPIRECLPSGSPNEWIVRLRTSAQRAGKL